MYIKIPPKNKASWLQVLLLVAMGFLLSFKTDAQETDTIVPIRKNAEEIPGSVTDINNQQPSTPHP